MKIIDDRVIARAALDAVKRSSRPAIHRSGRIADTAEAFALASMDLSRAGIVLSIETGQTLRDDILTFAADAKLMERTYAVQPMPTKLPSATYLYAASA